MSIIWSPEQVLALSPDVSSSQNGRKLATPSKWSNLGFTEGFTWGECQGSGKNPYRTQVDLGGPAFQCSCPSRKFPCKHSLGLLLLRAAQPELFVQDPLPAWVQAWMTQRSQTQRSQPPPAQASSAKANGERDPAAQAKRANKREAKVQAGLQALDQWLQDLMRQGLATSQTQPYRFWDEIAARMVDSQAPGLARRLQAMAGIPHTGVGWHERLLAELGRVHLLVQSYQRLDRLSPALQAEVRSQIGWTQSQADLTALAEQGAATLQRDHWTVLGKRVVEEDRLRVQRVWLWGKHSDQPALVLSFAHGKAPLDASLLPGTCLDMALLFYPAAYPLRALVHEVHAAPHLATVMPGGRSVRDAIAVYAQALQQNPWLDRLSLTLTTVVPRYDDDGWRLQDLTGAVLPIATACPWPWELLAISGGHPLTVTGEWEGTSFYPLGAWADDRWILF